MSKIIAIGETVFDIIFQQTQPVAAKPGGSMLNATVSLGRIHAPVSFISEYAKDEIGNIIDSFLRQNHVDTSAVYRYSNGKTSLAIAMLDDNKNANYTFYKELPDESLAGWIPEIEANDIVLYGSFFALSKRVRSRLLPLLRKAHDKGALMIYDPNFRKAHLHELEELMPMIRENMRLASIVRGSNEDFEMIYGTKTPDESYSNVSIYCPNLIYTKNSEAVYIQTKTLSSKFPVKSIKPLSTIGAGDNFNAGLIVGLHSKKITREQLSTLNEEQWQPLIATAVEFASEVCTSYDNYVSEEFADYYLKGKIV